MIKFSGIDTLGFNFVSRTSLDRAHILKVAASCGNHPDAVIRRNSTSSELASAITAANDGSLLLDEFPRDPGSDIGKVLYSIGNGPGENRSKKKFGRARIALLSTSEQPSHEMVSNAHRTMPEDFSMRLLDILADSWTYGMINDLHGHSDVHSYQQALSKAYREHHGHAVPHLIKIIQRQTDSFPNRFRAISEYYRSAILKELGLTKSTVSSEIDGAVMRFALIAAVGEIAIVTGVLPWPRYTAGTASADLAKLWYEAFNARQPHTPSALISILSTYIVENIDRFVDLEADHDADTEPNLGWQDSTFIYLHNKAINADDLNGETIRDVAQRLEDAGILVRGSEARSLQYKMPESLVRARPRVYRLRRAAMAM